MSLAGLVCRGEWKREGGEPWAQFGIVVRNYVNNPYHKRFTENLSNPFKKQCYLRQNIFVRFVAMQLALNLY